MEVADGLGVEVADGIAVGIDVLVPLGLGVDLVRFLMFSAPSALEPSAVFVGVGGSKLEAAWKVWGTPVMEAANSEKLDPMAESSTNTGAARRSRAAKKAIGMPARRRTRGSEGAGWGVSGSGIQLSPSSRLLDRFHGVCSAKVLASLPTARINDEGTTRSSTTDLPPPPDLRPSPA
ncbi:MAG TPA: hypothetical protein VMW80_10490, partial [Candidatus Dormibacteraeota bacterium]|nr:hypothetical protein [Candidatus Dormibacteraeota bacterium]